MLFKYITELVLLFLFAASAISAPIPLAISIADGIGELEVRTAMPPPSRAASPGRGHTSDSSSPKSKAQAIIVPSVQELKTKLMRVVPNKSLFFSGPTINGVQYKTKAGKYAAKHGLKVIEDLFSNPETFAPFDYGLRLDMPVADKNKFWDNASQAMAELSEGTAYVLLPKEMEKGKYFAGTVWERIESKALENNPKVTTLIHVNPDNDDKKAFKGSIGH